MNHNSSKGQTGKRNPLRSNVLLSVDLAFVDQLALIAASPGGDREGGWNSSLWPTVNKFRNQLGGDTDQYLDFVGLILDQLVDSRAEVRKLQMMVENGIGPDDIERDIY